MAVSDLIVRIFGDTKGLERSFAKAKKESAELGRSVETTGKKIDRSAKTFSAFTKGAAAGFGGAFALTTGIQQLKQLATVAAEAEQVLGQTRVALETTGKSWAKYGGIIEDTVKAQSKLGFDDEALLRTFSLFIRNTDDVGEALRRNNLAMDVARARFIDLEQAANLVNKAALGQAGALRRLGIDAKKGASGLELLTLLEEKYGGAAEAAGKDSATSFERTQVAMENLQEALGRLLLPALGRLANDLEEAATFAENLSTALGNLSRIKIPPIRIPFVFEGQGEGTLGDLAGKAGDALLRGIETMFPGVKFVNDVKELLGQQADDAAPDLAKSLDDAKRRLIEKALGLTAPGGFRDSGPGLAKQFASGIAGAIDQAQALAARTIKQGRARIAADKAADAAEKARESAEIAREKEAARRRAARAREQARQFRALGLAGTGDEIVPGIENLQKRIAGALRRVSTGELDVSSKLVERLKLARALIKREGGKVTEDTRRVINDLIRTVTQGTKALEDKGGPLTASMGLNVQKTLEGLGLTPEVERELRARLSGVNSAGRQLAGNNRPTGSFRTPGAQTETTVNVNLDGEQVAKVTRKSDQKNARRNPKQKRGPRSGI